MTEQKCSWCGAAIFQGACVHCGLVVDANPQTTVINRSGIAFLDAAMTDEDPDLPAAPGPEKTVTQPAAPASPYPGNSFWTPPSYPQESGGWDQGPTNQGNWSQDPTLLSHEAYTPPHYQSQNHFAPQAGASPHYSHAGYNNPPGVAHQPSAHYQQQAAHYPSQAASPGYQTPGWPATAQQTQPKSSGGQRTVIIVLGVVVVLLLVGVLAGVGLLLGGAVIPGTTPAAKPTRTSVAQPTRTIGQEATTPVTLEPDAPTIPVVESLPSGSWITILDSLPKEEVSLSQADAMAEALGPMVSVIDSDAIPGLNGGYWALGVTGGGSRAEAAAVCGALGREAGGSCYPRQVG